MWAPPLPPPPPPTPPPPHPSSHPPTHSKARAPHFPTLPICQVMADLQKVEGGVTGILLVQDGALVHYMEASNFHTNGESGSAPRLPATPPISPFPHPNRHPAFLRHLNTQGKGVVSDARVMLSSEDCDRRNFSKVGARGGGGGGGGSCHRHDYSTTVATTTRRPPLDTLSTHPTHDRPSIASGRRCT